MSDPFAESWDGFERWWRLLRPIVERLGDDPGERDEWSGFYAAGYSPEEAAQENHDFPTQ